MAKADCPQCGGTGWKTVESGDPKAPARVAVRCECSEADRTARQLACARIPRRYEHCDFDNFETDLSSGEPDAVKWDRSLEQAKVVVRAFAREFSLGTETGLLVMGPCGVGKTHLAVAALKEIVARGLDGLFCDYRELLKQIQSSYDAVSQTTEMEVLEPVLSVHLLVLDDVGASKPSAWALETVGHILNTRYNDKRPTLITTNFLDAETSERVKAVLPSGEGVPRTDDTLAARIGERIRSRLYEMCRTVEIIARDYRKEIRQAGRIRS